MGNIKRIKVESMVASKTGEGAVMLRVGEEFVNLAVEDAREVAAHLFEAAESAKQDAGLLAFMRENGFEDRATVVLLQKIRQMRREG